MSRRRTQRTIYLILHNVRSAYNVGAIWRTADAAGVAKIYLCGYTPTPDSNKIKKTALGAEKAVPWERHWQTWRLLATLSRKGVQIVALEQASGAIDYRLFKPRPGKTLALVVGHERKGLSKKILSYADKIIEIPMYGRKESLNVAVATGIELYELIKKPR